MKRVIVLFFFFSLFPFAISATAEAASMIDYCAIPPYVSQNIPPNVMLLVDNSGSMFNLAYACPSAKTTVAKSTAAGDNTAIVPVDSVSGFKSGQALALTSGGTTYSVWIQSIDTANRVLTLTAPVTSFNAGDTVKDYGCLGTLFYETPPDQTNPTVACPTTTTTCNTVTCASTTTINGGSSSTMDVFSVANFVVGQDIVILHGSAPYPKRRITGINTTNKTITVNSSLNVSAGDVVRDYCCYTSSGIAVYDATNFNVGEVVVLVHGGTPYTLAITAADDAANTATNDFTVTPLNPASMPPISKGDTIYDYNCYNYDNPYPEQSFEPAKTYYGYFNSEWWYTYTNSGGKFLPNRLQSAGAKQATEWDGNFLNWLTMRRADIVRKVLTGGRGSNGDGTGYDKLVGENPDNTAGRGTYKAVSNAQNYMGCTGCTGNVNFVFSYGSGNASSFNAYTGTQAAGWTARGSYGVSVRVPTPVEGVLQTVVGTRARLGLTFYKPNTTDHTTNHSTDGGSVIVNMGGTSLSSMVNQINNTTPSTNTPLGESLWTITGYFARQATLFGGPGPQYTNSDYPTTDAGDPLNYGTGGQAKFPYCAKSYVLVITDGEPCADGHLPATILNYATGRSNYACSGSSCPAVGPIPAATLPTCSFGDNVSGVEKVALYAHTTDLRNDSANTWSNISGMQNLTMFFVYAFGEGSTLLKYAAINGGFEDINGTGMPDSQATWDANGDDIPDNYYEAKDGAEIEAQVRNALSSILKRASSGTAASVLASGEGSGANLVQAVFYPKRRFGNDIIGWTGSLQNLWYYVDPFFANSQTREDTDNDQVLDLQHDYISMMYFDPVSQTTKAKLFADANGDALADNPSTPTAIKDFENIAYLWEAGKLLWGRDLSSDPRTIYTNCSVSGSFCIGSTGLMPFTSDAATATALAPYLQATDINGDGSVVQEAQNIIKFVQGVELTTIKDADGNVITPGVDLNSDSEDDFRTRTVTIGDVSHVWKLGDILDSTPKISSWLPLNTYNKVYCNSGYCDTTYGIANADASLGDAADPSHFLTTQQYKDRGMVFAGANDGMLHAFNLGKLEMKWTGQGTYEKARLTGTNIGREVWSFIPKNVLPYLKYTGDPDYCHVYTVDMSPYIFDASIGTTGCSETNYWDCVKSTTNPSNNWRTILIGGMKTGGACRGTATACNNDGIGTTDCVKTPVDVSGQSVGYSSYFALDITDQNNPILLWEFSNPQLGFATNGPSVVRINAYDGSGATATADKTKNGKWFVVLSSGPTGPIDTTEQQFLGRSDQNFRLFVLDLKTGSLVRTIDTGVQFGFGGSMVNVTQDNDLDYQDDAVYIGYTKRTSSSPYTWTNGGIGRLVTHAIGDNPDFPLDPANWRWSTVIDGIGPVTTSTARLLNTKTSPNILWLFFGSGRYFYDVTAAPDDTDGNRQIFGIKDGCYSGSAGYAASCSAVTLGNLTNVSNIANVPSISAANDPSFKGWYINLDTSGTYTYAPDAAKVFSAERVITDPLATTSGLVLFTSYKPYNSDCGVGGKSFIWATQYNTGGAPGALLKGKALIQVSTAVVEQINMSQAFTQASGRRTSAIEGVPPTAQGLFLISTPPPVKRTMHFRER